VKTSFKNYLSEQKQEMMDRLLQVVSMDTTRSRELAINFLHKKQPVPEILIKTVSESPTQSTMLARAYVMDRLDPPRELIISISDDNELSLKLAGAYMESYHHLNPFEKIPDMIMNSVASHTPIAFKFAKNLTYYYGQSLMSWKTNPFPPIIIRSLKRNDEYLKQFQDYVQTLQNPFLVKYLMGLLQKNEENEEKQQQFNKEKYLPKLLEIISQDENQLLITVNNYLDKGMRPPEILLRKMVQQNEGGSGGEYGKKLIQIFEKMVDEKMQIPDYLHQHMVMRYPFVVWRSYMSNDLPVPKKAEEQIYKNPFLVAAVARNFMNQNKPIPERALQVLSKNPREVYYILETQIRKWIGKNTFAPPSSESVKPIPLPEPLVKAILKDKKILEDSIKMLKNHNIDEKYWPFRKKKEGKK